MEIPHYVHGTGLSREEALYGAVADPDPHGPGKHNIKILSPPECQKREIELG